MLLISTSNTCHPPSLPKPRASLMGNSSSPPNAEAKRRWRTDGELQRAYSSKLLEALRRSRSRSRSLRRSRSLAVREAADRILATAGRGNTRWSRAILLRRNNLNLINLNLKRKRKHCRWRKDKGVGDGNLSAKKKEKRLRVVESKKAVLGRLVPGCGCGRVSFAALLEEASDYIAALEMQVRGMAAVADILSASGGVTES